MGDACYLYRFSERLPMPWKLPSARPCIEMKTSATLGLALSVSPTIGFRLDDRDSAVKIEGFRIAQYRACGNSRGQGCIDVQQPDFLI